MEDHIVLILKRSDDWRTRVLNIFFPVPDERRVVLDAIGSLIWRGCDGDHTINQFVGQLQKEYKLGAREAELSLQQFFKDLGRRGYVGFVTETKDGKKKGSA